MTETVIHVVGHIGTDVDHREVGNGTQLSTFRLAATPRYWDRAQRAYVDGATNWLSVQCWRSLAAHVHESLKRGDPVIVIGKLKTQEWEKDGVRSSRFVLEATAVGHDLTRGVSTFTKMARVPESYPDPAQAAVQAAQEVEDAPVGPPEGAHPFAEGRLADAS
jgi:single-strand DNA-binding protein